MAKAKRKTVRSKSFQRKLDDAREKHLVPYSPRSSNKVDWKEYAVTRPRKELLSLENDLSAIAQKAIGLGMSMTYGMLLRANMVLEAESRGRTDLARMQCQMMLR